MNKKGGIKPLFLLEGDTEMNWKKLLSHFVLIQPELKDMGPIVRITAITNLQEMVRFSAGRRDYDAICYGEDEEKALEIARERVRKQWFPKWNYWRNKDFVCPWGVVFLTGYRIYNEMERFPGAYEKAHPEIKEIEETEIFDVTRIDYADYCIAPYGKTTKYGHIVTFEEIFGKPR